MEYLVRSQGCLGELLSVAPGIAAVNLCVSRSSLLRCASERRIALASDIRALLCFRMHQHGSHHGTNVTGDVHTRMSDMCARSHEYTYSDMCV